MKYAITITFKTEKRVPEKLLALVACDAYTQVESLSDDHGIPYTECLVYSRRVKDADTIGPLENALRCLVARFPIEGWACRPDGGCACLQYEDKGECRHTQAVKALAAMDAKRA